MAVGSGGDRQYPARRLNSTVERELAEDHDVLHVATLDDSLRGQDAERDGQVEGRARLTHVSGGEVHRDAVGRKRKAGVADGASDAVAAFTHARIGQPHHRHERQAEAHVDFHVDGTGVDPEQGSAAQAGQHGAIDCKNGRTRARSTPPVVTL